MPALSDTEFAELQQLAADPSVEPALKARAQKAIEQRTQEQAASQMDPSMPLLPQALAMQPATTHPQGDDKAREEWISDPSKASLLGAKYWYEPPIAIARKDLSNPDMAQMLNPHPDQPVTSEELAGLTEDAPLYQAYADHKWRGTAEEAAKNGITAYRYAKAPWLHSDNGMGTLQTLAMKLAGSAVPLMNIKDAFVLGADKSITAGAGRRLQEHLDPLAQEAVGAATGKVSPAGNAREENAQNESDHAGTVAAGGVLGALPGWGSATAAYEAATGARVLAPYAAEGAGLLSRTLAGGVAGAAGGALAQGAEEGVNAVADAAEGKGLAVREGAAGRMEGSAIGGGVLGSIAGGIGSIAGGLRNYIGGRHGGAVNEFERAGGKITMGGPQPAPAVAAAEAEGAKLGVNPVDLHADRLAPKIEESSSGRVKNTIGEVHDENAAHYATPEGRQLLPMTNTIQTATDLLRKGVARGSENGKLADIVEHSSNGRVRAVLNNEIQGTSLKPKPGAVEVTPEEADHMLASHHKQELLDQLVPSAKPSASGAAAAPAEPKGDLTPKMQTILDELKGGVKDRRTLAEKMPNGHEPHYELDQLEKQGLVKKLTPEERKPGSRIDAQYKLTEKASESSAKPDAGERQPEPGKGALRDALASKGVDKVYLIPKRYSAEEMQSAAERLRRMSDANSQDPGRDAFSKMHVAALQDRDARTLNGVPGGWGAKKAAQSARLGEAKTEKRLTMQPSVGKPKGDAFQPLTQYSREAVGQYPLTKALRESAGRAGVTPELEQLRQLGVLSNLRGMANFGNVGGTTRSPLSPGPLIDAASIRAYPALKALGGPINPVHLAAGSSLLNAGEREADREENQ